MEETEETAGLKRRLAELQRENAALQAQTSTLGKSVQTPGELETAIADALVVQEQLRARRKELEAMAQAIEVDSVDTQTLVSRLTRLRAANEAQANANDTLEGKMSAERELLNDKAAETSRALAEATRKERHLQDLKKELLVQQENAAARAAKIRQEADEASMLVDQNSVLEQEVSGLKEKLATLARDRASNKSESSRKRHELEARHVRLSNELAHLQAELKAQHELNAASAAKDLFTGLVDENTQLANALTTYRNKMAAYIDSLNDSTVQLNQTCLELELEKVAKASMVQHLKAELDKTKAGARAVRGKLAEDNSVARLKAEIAVLADEAADLSEHVLAAKTETGSLIHSRKRDEIAAEAHRQGLVAEVEHLRAQLESIPPPPKHVQEELATNSVIELELQELEREIASLQTILARRLAESKQSPDTVSRRRALLLSKRTELETELKAVQRLMATERRFIAEVEAASASEEASFAAKSRVLAAQIADNKAVYAELLRRREQVSGLKKDLELRNAQLDKQIGREMAARENMVRTDAVLMDELKDARALLAEKLAEYKTHASEASSRKERQAKEARAVRTELTSLLSSVADVESRLTALAEEDAGRAKSHNERMADLRAQVVSARETRDATAAAEADVLAKRREQAVEVATLQAELARAQEETAVLEAKLERSMVGGRVGGGELQARIDALTSAISDEISKAQGLRGSPAGGAAGGVVGAAGAVGAAGGVVGGAVGGVVGGGSGGAAGGAAGVGGGGFGLPLSHVAMISSHRVTASPRGVAASPYGVAASPYGATAGKKSSPYSSSSYPFRARNPIP